MEKKGKERKEEHGSEREGPSGRGGEVGADRKPQKYGSTVRAWRCGGAVVPCCCKRDYYKLESQGYRSIVVPAGVFAVPGLRGMAECGISGLLWLGTRVPIPRSSK